MEITFGCTECDEWITTDKSDQIVIVRCPKCGVENSVGPNGVFRPLVMNSGNWISECSDELYKKIQDSLREGINKGEATRKLAERVQRELPTVGKDRAFIIAQAETAAAYGESHFHSIKHSGFKTKRWLTCKDHEVRKSHRKCKSQGAIPIDQPFHNGLMYPGHLGSGNIDECLGCRCYLAPGDFKES